MRITAFILLFCLSLLSIAQEDYVVTLKGETIEGKVNFEQGQYYDKVVVRSSEGKQKFNVFQLKSINKDGNSYEKVSYNKKQCVGQIIVKGTVSFYKVIPDGGNDFSESYLVMSSGESIIVPNISFKKNVLRFFGSCQAVVEKIESKEFTSSNLDKMVEFYNSTCTDSDSAPVKETPPPAPPKKERPKLSELSQLLLDIQTKLDNNETVPTYLIEALKGWTESDINQEIADLIEELENN